MVHRTRTAARFAAVLAFALATLACASAQPPTVEGEKMAITIGTPVWTFQPNVTVEGGATASASLGLGNILDPSPSSFARFASVAPGETWLQAHLGDPRPLRQIGLVGPFREADHVRFQASLSTIPGPEGVAPEAILLQANLVGSLADIQDDPDDPGDATWLLAPAQTDGELLVRFPGRANLLSGPLSQEIRMSLRGATEETGPTSVVVQLRQAGKVRAAETHVIEKTDPRTISLVWDAGSLPDPSGPFEVRIASATASVGGGLGPAVEVGALRWVAASAADGHDSGFLPAPVATADPLWQGSKAPPRDHEVVYYETGETVETLYLRVDIRRSRESAPPEVGALVATVGYSPSVVANVTPTGPLAGFQGLPEAVVTGGGQSHHGSVQEPRRTLRVDLPLLPRAEALELSRRLWGSGPAVLLLSLFPEDPSEMDTLYCEVVAGSGSATPIGKVKAPEAPYNLSFQVVEKR